MKWRTTTFPWFEDIKNVLGDSAATRRHAFLEDECVEDINDEDSESAALLPTPRISTSRLTTIDDVKSAGQAMETCEPERTRNSGPVLSRRKKVSGLDVMEKMVEGIAVMAEAVRPSHSSGAVAEPRQILQGTIDYAIQAQAQEKVQEEPCLTEAGQLFMVERFTDPVLARTYLSLKKESLRIMFLKKQVENEDGNYFIDWPAV
jgi:hypothetical protein